MKGDVTRNIQHGTHSEIRLVRPQHRHAVGAGDVVQPDTGARVLIGKLLEILRQDVEDGGLAGGDVEEAAVEIAAAFGKRVPQRVHALHQGQGDFQQGLSIRRQPDLGPTALEQHGVEFPLQRLYLQ